MAESKYSLKLAAIDAYSSTFGDMSKKAKSLQDVIKAQQAEIKKLNSQARDVSGHQKLAASLQKTEEALKAARAEQSRLSREQQLAQTQLAALKAAHESAATATRRLEVSTEASAKQVRAARAEEARLAAELKTVTAAAQRLDAQQDKTTASVRTLEIAQRGERNELGRLTAKLTEAGIDTGKLAGEQKRLEAATDAANAALKSQRARLDAVAASQAKIDGNRAARADLRGRMVETAAIGYLASRPVDQAMSLETAMADVGKVLAFSKDDKEQAAGLAAMGNMNLQMAQDRRIAASGMTAVDLAKIEYAAGQSGIGNEEKTADGKRKAIIDFTKDAAIMGSAFDIDAQTAGETMAGWRASMKLDRGGTLDLADATNYLGNNFNAKAADIAGVVKRFGAVGSASGLKPEQSAALSAALLNPGTEKEIAGTGFKNFLSALTAGKSATKGEKTQWKELGFDPEELASDMQANAPATILEVLNKIKDAPREEQAAIATTLFGSESIGAIQPLLENLEPLQRAFGMVADKSKYATSVLGDQASMMQEAEGVAKTSRTSWNVATAAMSRLTTIIGQSMLPALEYVLTPLTSGVNMLANAAEKYPQITAGLAVAAGGLAALKVGALGLKFVGLLIGQGFNKAGLARAKLDASTARSAVVADAAVTRLNAAMAGIGTGSAGAAGGPDGRGKGKARGKLGARLAGAGKLAGRVGVPLMLLSAGLEAADGLESGDASKVGSGVGGAAGGLGGAWAGGVAGAAIGSVVPVIGTAIGGVIGSLAGGFFGGEAGSWLGDKLGGLIGSDRLASPEAMKKDITSSTDNRQITFAPVISIQGMDQNNADKIVSAAVEKMRAQFVPMMTAPLAVRRDASLTDGGS